MTSFNVEIRHFWYWLDVGQWLKKQIVLTLLSRGRNNEVDVTNQRWFIHIDSTFVNDNVWKTTLTQCQCYVDKSTLQTQPCFNVKTTLINRRWTNVCKSTLVRHRNSVVDLATFLRPKLSCSRSIECNHYFLLTFFGLITIFRNLILCTSQFPE